jgi:site-specific DNA-adenine methylase
MITALVPWYGSNRLLAHKVGEQLVTCHWVGVPFAGSMTEIRHMSARTILVNDLHTHLIHLAQTVSDPIKGPQVYRRLRRLIFHPHTLREAQVICKEVSPDEIEWAVAYFVVSWMSRNGSAGTKSELSSSLATRWNATGGDSAKRFANAVAGLPEWRRLMRKCSFVCMDAFEFLKKVKDQDDCGVYCDPPFPGPGDKYKHTFSEKEHIQLSDTLGKFQRARIVCRFHDHPLIRKLYADWTWIELEGRDQHNSTTPEVLLSKN